jgi:lambda repressor-like predicted transcriptional regulator
MGTWDDLCMPRSNNDQLPATYVTVGKWPHARLADDAPISAHYAQALARNLQAAIDTSGLVLRALGEKSGVSHATVSRLLRGLVLPDIGTIARLEEALDADVWPRRSDMRGRS